MFHLLYADNKGRIYDHPDLLAVGRTGNLLTGIDEAEAIPLPEGASLVLIPGGIPVGMNNRGQFSMMDADRSGQPVFAVGVLLPQGFTRTLLPGYRRQDKKPLPLFGYGAVGWKNGEIYAAALQTDEHYKWNPVNYSTPELAQLVRETVNDLGDNRIIRQLSRCALEYSCFTAQNIFYRRWEGGIPASPACNAQCLGCISLQPSECCPSPQTRIDFVPTSQEIAEIAVTHLAEAAEGIISFGQGCEGEPSLAADNISLAIAKVRRKTGKGTINMNTNAGYTDGIKRICLAGIDSLRVSTVSAREATYTRYYSPRGYNWDDVCSSVAFGRRHGVYISLNLLTLPGLTDLPDEAEALINFIRDFDINMVQFRNLNIDPDYLNEIIPLAREEVLGIDRFIEILKEEIPGIAIGNYSKPVNRPQD